MNRFITVSSPPQNVTLLRVTNTMARLQWSEPKSPNGRLQGYRVYILNIAANLTEVKKLVNPQLYSVDFPIHGLSKQSINIFIEVTSGQTAWQSSESWLMTVLFRQNPNNLFKCISDFIVLYVINYWFFQIQSWAQNLLNSSLVFESKFSE